MPPTPAHVSGLRFVETDGQTLGRPLIYQPLAIPAKTTLQLMFLFQIREAFQKPMPWVPPPPGPNEPEDLPVIEEWE